jgi:flagellar motor switch protein FliM
MGGETVTGIDEFMADGGEQGVLGQKARAAQRAHEARGMSTAKALRRALARTAEDRWALALVCNGVELDMLDQDGVVEALGTETLLVVLDGPDGATGLAQIDRSVLAGVTEIQTIQQVTKMPVDTRPLTHTDAAMIAPLLDGGLAEFAENLVGNPLRPQLEGYRFGAMLEDARSAGLLLDAAEYRTFHAEIDLALGTRTGRISLFLPVRRIEPPEAGQPAAAREPHREVMMSVSVRLDCILARVKVPLSRAESLQPGDLIPLAASALDGVEVSAPNGAIVAGGRLGQMNGARAVRINWPRTAGAGAIATAGAAGFDDDLAGAEAETLEEDAGSSPALDFAEPAEDLTDFPGGADDAAEDDPLPDLPPLDFDDGGFDADFDAAALGDEAPEAGDDAADDDFAAATMDFDFET